MCNPISFLVDKDARVHAVPGIHSHAGIAEKCGVSEDQCLKYEFVLVRRELKLDHCKSWPVPYEEEGAHRRAAEAYVQEVAGTVRKLIKYVREGGLGQDEAWVIYNILAGLGKAQEEMGTARRRRFRTEDEALERYHDRVKTQNERALRAEDRVDKQLAKGKITREQWNKKYSEIGDRMYSHPDVVKAQALRVRSERTATKKYRAELLRIFCEGFGKKANRIEVWK